MTAPLLFSPIQLGPISLSNRLMISPMCQYSAQDDGIPNDWHMVHYGARAVGGAGLMFTEMTDVSKDARITPGCASLYDDAQEQAWKRIVDFVHERTQSKIGVQLAHAGRKGSTKLSWEGDSQPLAEGNWEIVAPSPLPYYPQSQIPRALTRADMNAIVFDYVEATKRAARVR